MDENKVLTKEDIAIIESLVPVLQKFVKAGVLVEGRHTGEVVAVVLRDDAVSYIPSTQEIYYEPDCDTYETYNNGIHYRVVM